MSSDGSGEASSDGVRDGGGGGDWAPFSVALGSVIGVLEVDQFLILSGTGNRFVQVMVDHGGVRLESVSNQYLTPEHQLDFEGLDRLKGLGWNEPSHFSPGDPVPLVGSPNHFIDLGRGGDPQWVAEILVETLRGIHRVDDLSDVTYRAGTFAGAVILLPTLGLRRS